MLWLPFISFNFCQSHPWALPLRKSSRVATDAVSSYSSEMCVLPSQTKKKNQYTIPPSLLLHLHSVVRAHYGQQWGAVQNMQFQGVDLASELTCMLQMMQTKMLKLLNWGWAAYQCHFTILAMPQNIRKMKWWKPVLHRSRSLYSFYIMPWGTCVCSDVSSWTDVHTSHLSCLLLSFPSGIKHEWQVNGLEDLKDRHTLAEKLGGTSVVTLEGCPI